MVLVHLKLKCYVDHIFLICTHKTHHNLHMKGITTFILINRLYNSWWGYNIILKYFWKSLNGDLQNCQFMSLAILGVYNFLILYTSQKNWRETCNFWKNYSKDMYQDFQLKVKWPLKLSFTWLGIVLSIWFPIV